MGQAIRTTKLPLDFYKQAQGGANTRKRGCLEATIQALDAARAFCAAFFPDFPSLYRRAIIQDAIGNVQLWQHIRRMNKDVAHKTARAIANVCARYPSCLLLFERLRKIKSRGGSKSRRLNRTQANQLRGHINRLSREKAFAQGMVTVEVNPHGTSQYCSRCGAQGQRFSFCGNQRLKARGASSSTDLLAGMRFMPIGMPPSTCADPSVRNSYQPDGWRRGENGVG